MEWVLIGGLIVWIVFTYIQVTRLEHQNSLLRQENAELYRLLSYRNATDTAQSPGCAWIMLLLLLVVGLIYISAAS